MRSRHRTACLPGSSCIDYPRSRPPSKYSTQACNPFPPNMHHTAKAEHQRQACPTHCHALIDVPSSLTT